jgi:hypothetical protein
MANHYTCKVMLVLNKTLMLIHCVYCVTTGRGGTLRQAHDDAVNELREFKAEHCSSEADYADRVTELTEIVEHCLMLYTQRVIYGYGTKLGVGKSGGGSSAITLNRTVAALSVY